MSPRQNRYTPLTQPLDRYPQIQPLIDPIAYGALEQKVENHGKRIESLENEIRENRDKSNVRKGWNATLIAGGSVIIGVIVWGVNAIKDLLISH